MPSEVPHPFISNAAFVRVTANKMALYASMHELLDPDITDLLGLFTIDSLTISLYENGVYLGVNDPTTSYRPRLIFATGVFQTVLVDNRTKDTVVWSSTEGEDDLRPVRGLFVPANVAVGLQCLQNNRCTYIVLGHRGVEPVPAMEFDDPLIVDRWQRQVSDRVRSVVSGRHLP